jgi:hypothetical protein
MYLGEFQRLNLVRKRRIKRSKAWPSSSMPQNALPASFPSTRLKPVPGASMKTRSLASSRLYWFSMS